VFTNYLITIFSFRRLPIFVLLFLLPHLSAPPLRASSSGFADIEVQAKPKTTGTGASHDGNPGFGDVETRSIPRDNISPSDTHIDNASKFARKLFDCEKGLDAAVSAIPKGPVNRTNARYKKSIRNLIKETRNFQSILRSFVRSPTRRGLQTEFESIERSFKLVVSGANKAIRASGHYLEDDVKREPYFETLYRDLLADARAQIDYALHYTLRGEGLQVIVRPANFKEIVDASSAKLREQLQGKLSEIAVESITHGRLPKPKTVATEALKLAGDNYYGLLSNLRDLPRNTLGHSFALALVQANGKLLGTPLGQAVRQYRHIQDLRKGAPMKELILTTFRARLKRIIFGRSGKISLSLTKRRLLIQAGQGILINIAMEILLPKLKEAFRPKDNLGRRMEISIGTLRDAMNRLNSLGIDRGAANVHLTVVKNTCLDAIGTLNATRFLKRDITRALGDKAKLIERYYENLEQLPLSRWEPGSALKLGPPGREAMAIEAYDENMGIIKENRNDSLFMKAIDLFVTIKKLEHTIQRTRARFILENGEKLQQASEKLQALPYLLNSLQQLMRSLETSTDSRIFFIVPKKYSADGTCYHKGPYATVSLLPSLRYFDPVQKTNFGESQTKTNALHVVFNQAGKVYRRKYLVEISVGDESRFVFVNPMAYPYYGSSKFRLENGKYKVGVSIYTEEGRKLYFEYALVVDYHYQTGTAYIQRSEKKANEYLDKFNEAAKKYNAGQVKKDLVLGYANLARRFWGEHFQHLALYSTGTELLKQTLENVLYFDRLARDYLLNYEKNPQEKKRKLYWLTMKTLQYFSDIGDEEAYGQAKAYFNKYKKFLYHGQKLGKGQQIGSEVGAYLVLGEFAISLGKIHEGVAFLKKAKSLMPPDKLKRKIRLRTLPEDYR